MDELLNDFPVVITVPILWGDMDAMQHVNNTVYLKHFEHGRMAYFDRIQVDQVIKSTGIGPILAETTCRFRIPLTYPDQVSIGTRVTEVGDDRLTMEHRVVSHNHLATMFSTSLRGRAAEPGIQRKPKNLPGFRVLPLRAAPE